MSSKQKVLIGIGSNVGNRRRYLTEALRSIHERADTEVLQASSLIETAPVGGPPQGPYLNGAAVLETKLSPRALLDVLQRLEKDAGRTHRTRNGPRPLDLDILLYSGQTVDEPGLRIPHPRFLERMFALMPASEIAADWEMPGGGRVVDVACDLAEATGLRHPSVTDEDWWEQPTIPDGKHRLEVFHRLSELRARISDLLADGVRVGFVPTMGALHEGHGSLVGHSARHQDVTVASIFVNPTQFGENEDLSAYPRTPEKDIGNLKRWGCDLLWMPIVEEMYRPGFSSSVSMTGLVDVLCGASRPTHFGGVQTVVLKLLNQVRPHVAYFGRKDYQQALIIKRMVRDLDVSTQIEACPIIREADGLAMSSRNRYLTESERVAAPQLRRTLRAMDAVFTSGERDAGELLKVGRQTLAKEPRFTLDYLDIRDPETLANRDTLAEEGDLVAVAAQLGRARLIDNLLLGIEGEDTVR